MNRYVCINKITGHELDKKEPCDLRVARSDWIDPSLGYECINKNTKKKYHTKKDCNVAQSFSEDVKFKKLDNTGVFHNYDKYKKPTMTRKNSRIRLLVILMVCLTLLSFSWVFVNELDIFGNDRKKWILSIIPSVSLGIIILCGFLIMFCPMGICSLDPESNKFRRVPIAYIHRKLRIIKK